MFFSNFLKFLPPPPFQNPAYATAQAPSIEFQWFAQSAFSVANFFKSILYVKIGEVEVNY